MSTTRNPRIFLDDVGPWLCERLAENNLVVGIATSARDIEGLYVDPWFAVVRDGEEPALAAVRTPPRHLVLGRGAVGAVPALVRAARDAFGELPGVVGPRSEAESFASHWGDAGWREEMAMRAYQLTEVFPDARRVTGSLREADSGDLELLTEWILRFREDAHVHDPTPADEVAGRMVRGRAWLLEVGDEPVCVVAGADDLPEAARVGMVFTPTHLRGRGYGSATTAAVSQILLDRGARACFLFTDLANPTSNAIYQRIGYQPVCDFTSLGATPPDEGG